jgi:hypothetical protein
MSRVVTCRNGDKIEKKEAKMESDMSSDSDAVFLSISPLSQ